ncbi:MAG: isoleucine--tRNA ligase [Acidobacteriota bacterium]
MKKDIDFKRTLNLPSTDFRMKADLLENEPKMIRLWDEIGLYDLIRQERKGRERFVLHDGPPYANGNIHLGQALNKILKDFIVKSRTMMGYDVPYLPGWDCHGLPIEHMVDQQLGENKFRMNKLEIRRQCRAYAEKYIEVQKKEFIRLGIFGEWSKPYTTLDGEYEATVIDQLGKFFANGSIYFGKKPVHWCSFCRTALAEAEVEYDDHVSTSIYVKFRLLLTDELLSEIPPLRDYRDKTFVVIWTTTPWTLPANRAIALNPDFEYVFARSGGEVYLVARDLQAQFAMACGIQNLEALGSVKGKELDWKFPKEPFLVKHPLYDFYAKLINGEHVTLEQGTGCVHTAPGHGEDDFIVGKRYPGLEAYAPVADDGRFTEDAGKYAGLHVFDSNSIIIEDLKRNGSLLSSTDILHQYPHCWRCKQPTIFRATEQWFISMDRNDLRVKALEEVRKVRWIPDFGEQRIYNMIETRPDWCISRQRVWGVPIPIFICKKSKSDDIHFIQDKNVFDHIADLFKKYGSDFWFQKSVGELLPEGTKCSVCGSGEFRKEEIIVDVWFESGSSHCAVLGKREDLPWPSDVYLEGSDQYRGWFHSSLLVAVNNRGSAPYRTVITHGFTLDGEGRKMSKSLGNVISPMEVCNEMGAEVLRLWVSMIDYLSDMRLSEEILRRNAEAYRKIRNTFRYFLGNLYDFDPEKDSVPYSEMLEIDRWALLHLNSFIKKILSAYENYMFHVIYHSLHNFCAVSMSSFYLDILKDRLYTAAQGSRRRRSAQTALFRICESLCQLMAPILCFTAEDVWRSMPGRESRKISVHLTEFPALLDLKEEPELLERWDRLREIREDVSKALEIARQEKMIGNSLESKVRIDAPDEVMDFLKSFGGELRFVFLVSQVEFGKTSNKRYFSEKIKGLSIEVLMADGEKCQRCWNYSSDVGVASDYPGICGRCVQAIESGIS